MRIAASIIGQDCKPVARRDSHEVSGYMHIRVGDVSLFLTRDELRLLTISLLDIVAADQAAANEVLS